jgi:hypothetical protein
VKPSQIYLRAAEIVDESPGLYRAAILMAGGSWDEFRRSLDFIGWPDNSEELVIGLLLMSAMCKAEGR